MIRTGISVPASFGLADRQTRNVTFAGRRGHDHLRSNGEQKHFYQKPVIRGLGLATVLVAALSGGMALLNRTGGSPAPQNVPSIAAPAFPQADEPGEWLKQIAELNPENFYKVFARNVDSPVGNGKPSLVIFYHGGGGDTIFAGKPDHQRMLYDELNRNPQMRDLLKTRFNLFRVDVDRFSETPIKIVFGFNGQETTIPFEDSRDTEFRVVSPNGFDSGQSVAEGMPESLEGYAHYDRVVANTGQSIHDMLHAFLEKYPAWPENYHSGIFGAILNTVSDWRK